MSESQQKEQSPAEAGSSSEGEKIHLTFWIAYKKGADRPYVHSTCPPVEIVKKWKEDGFRFFQAMVFLPVRDGAEAILGTTAKEIDVPRDD